MRFEEELRAVLPPDLPNRERVILAGARHLELIGEANQRFNLTRITSPREAAIKHVLDSVLPWRRFAGASRVLDAGTGAGFPGIPLALVLPEVSFVLTDSVGKKSDFAASAARELKLTNVTVHNGRGEQLASSLLPGIITGRAFAPIAKSCDLFGKAVRRGAVLLLYKGPDPSAEIQEAALEARKFKLKLNVVERYELPDGMGRRTMVEIA